jgi:NitT/TauT family transport system permease protein
MSTARPAAMKLRPRSIIGFVAVLVAVALAWEAVKWIAGDPWRLHATVAGIRIDYEHFPPLKWTFAKDLALPHVWSILGVFGAPSTRVGPPVWQVLIGASLYTLREAFAGFVVGALLGLGLGALFVRFSVLERAFIPYVVASQTIPLITIAPIIVIYLGAQWTSVAFIAAYLTFFPVTVAALRGLRAADPRAFELMRASAASETQIFWKLRLPASVPYLFSAFRVSAAASIVGAIIGELPSGLPDGLGGQILQTVQYYITGPEKLWATVAAAALLGIVFVGLVVLAETVLTHGRYRTTTAS